MTSRAVSSSEYARSCVRKAIATICAAHGFHTVTREALHTLVVLFERRLAQLARTTLAITSLADERERDGLSDVQALATVSDVQYAFDAHGVTLRELADYAVFCSKPAIVYPSESLRFPAGTVSNLQFDEDVLEHFDETDSASLNGLPNGTLHNGLSNTLHNGQSNGVTDNDHNTLLTGVRRLAVADRTLLERAFPEIEAHFPSIVSVPNWRKLAAECVRRREVDAQRERDVEMNGKRPFRKSKRTL